MSSTHESKDKSRGDSGDASALPAELLRIARVGLSAHSAAETMLWEELDLDNPDDRLFGDYELLERIGRGGMGVVFRAHQHSLGREVAIKFIIGSLADNAPAVARFLGEARAAARLHHPHIVPVFEVGSVEGMHFFSMPLLRGQTLAQRIAGVRMTPAETVALLLKLGSAVDYAHSLGLLHLDLKPANVLFDEHTQPLIGDFGLARHMDAEGGVDAHELSGTPAYMAPEQIDVGSHRLSRRTDVYCLGAILYEALTGVSPHGQGDAKAQMQVATTGRVLPLRTLDSTIDKDLEAICMKCLRADPRQRYQSVADMDADLARYRDGSSVSVRNPPWHERAWRSVRRHPAIALATFTALIAMMLGLATTGWQWQRAERARMEADRQKSLATAQAERMQQLAGFIAAAFPTGDGLRDGRSSSARDAVAWLRQHASGDPSAQRAVMTSFRRALTAANKGDAVAALVNEIFDQLGEDYRQQQSERLAKKGDRDSLTAATLIGVPRGADGVSSAAHAAVVQRLFDNHADDPIALYAAALACHVQPQPCMHPEYYGRLVAQFPDNAVHWVLVPRGAKPTDPVLADHVLHAAGAKQFDDRLAPITGVLRTALGDQQVPESILQPMQAVVEEAEVAPSLRRNAVDSASLPMYGDILRICKPDSAVMVQVTGLRDACGAFAEKGMRSPAASILSRLVSSVILRRLYKGTPLAAEAKEYRRQYVWLGEH